MTQYQLGMPRQVFGGEQAMEALACLAKGRGKAAVFTDRGICASGAIRRVLDQLQAAGKSYLLFDDLPTEPSCDQAQQVVDRFRESDADWIIAVGGGSVMDVAKLASIAAEEGCRVRELLEDPLKGRKRVFSVMIPTTAGTGAEATPNSIVSVPEKRLKVGIVNPEMTADAVILDAAMTQNLPRHIAASTGIDALCHAVECYISAKATPFSDMFAMQALRLIFENLGSACDNPRDSKARERMLQASFYAGVAITCSGTTAVHALSYPLGGRYHIPHGVANAIMLMPVMQFTRPCCEGRLAEIYDAVGPGTADKTDKKASWVIRRMGRMIRHLDIPVSLRPYGVSEKELPELVRAGMEVQRLLVNNPRRVEPADAEAIYRSVL